eukprot:CAMPEP_0197883142 /NCGR_PEP_ID=MMETSP1439-20131203/10070_1 /TAXON_ID=66791 /ORGANISM="Gonyaulax spinifera, Strain CCMP409" /LENGTH=61 /DNA_ID=CAMNT_0043502849 /DNA_START=282 /DNA_END=467 /DNA_ORIENTATION=+
MGVLQAGIAFSRSGKGSRLRSAFPVLGAFCSATPGESGMVLRGDAISGPPVDGVDSGVCHS